MSAPPYRDYDLTAAFYDPVGAHRDRQLDVKLFRYEVEHLLIRAGFVEVEVFADFQGTSCGTITPGELVVRARRG